MPNVGRRSREIAEEEFPEITWEHSHVIVDESGGVRTFCVYGAPDEETVRSHGKRLGSAHDQRRLGDRGRRNACRLPVYAEPSNASRPSS